MNTPPPEQDTFKPDPFPSVSTPVLPPPTTTTTTSEAGSSRPRRYTQPTASLEATHEEADAKDDDELDRISDILANLIREANDAVHGLERERGKILQRQQHQYQQDQHQDQHPPAPNVRMTSRLPRPKSFALSSSSSSLVANTMLQRQRRPLPPPPIATAPLLESFQRLDTSMALVDSLSRDLTEHQHQHHDHFTALFFVPLLHIPHALITSLFNAASAPPNFSGMIAWACLFALGNLMLPSKEDDPPAPRRLSLPGAYHDDNGSPTTTTATPGLAGRDDNDTCQLHSLPPPPPQQQQPASPSRVITPTHVRKRRPTILRRSIYRKRAPPTSRQSMMPLSRQQPSPQRTTMQNIMTSTPPHMRRRNSV